MNMRNGASAGSGRVAPGRQRREAASTKTRRKTQRHQRNGPTPAPVRGAPKKHRPRSGSNNVQGWWSGIGMAAQKTAVRKWNPPVLMAISGRVFRSCLRPAGGPQNGF